MWCPRRYLRWLPDLVLQLQVGEAALPRHLGSCLSERQRRQHRNRYTCTRSFTQRYCLNLLACLLGACNTQHYGMHVCFRPLRGALAMLPASPRPALALQHTAKLPCCRCTRRAMRGGDYHHHSTVLLVCNVALSAAAEDCCKQGEKGSRRYS